MTVRPVPLSAVMTVCGLLVGTALVLTWQGLALAADGSYYLVQILGTEGVYGPDFRLLANVVRQAPVLLAAGAGETDTHVLTLLHGAGQLLLPATVWSMAIALTRADRIAFAAVAMTATLCLGTTWFFTVSESILTASLTTLIAVLLWQPRAWRSSDVTIAAGASLVLVASYETTLLSGAVLAVWAAWRATRSALGLERYGCALVCALSVLSVVVALLGTRSGANPTSSQSFLYFVVSLEPWPFYVALAGVAMVTAAMGPWLQGISRPVALGLGCAALVVALLGLELNSVTAFQARGGVTIAAFLLAVSLFWRWITQPNRLGEAEPQADEQSWGRLLAYVPVAFVVSMVAVNVEPMTEWSRSLDAFRTEVDRREGVARANDVLPAGRQDVLWNWSAPSLSLIVRAEPDAGILVDSSPTFVPFPPGEARAQLADEYTWGK